MLTRLLDMLCCPDCKAGLLLENAAMEGARIKSGILKCSGCGKEYHVVNFVPRFVPCDQYAGNFSFEWTVHRVTQLDSISGRSYSKDTFKERMGIDLPDFADKRVLDVGCGTGRLMEHARQYAAEVVGVDISYAVDSAQANLGKYENVHIIQADAFRLPFRDNTFDAVYSFGVLHHTPDTRAAFLRLPQLLKTNGQLAIWVYSDETLYARIKNRITDVYRLVTSRLPEKLLWRLCHIAVPLYYIKKLPLMHTLLDCIFPTSSDPDPVWRVLDTFDWYSPRYQYKHTYAEVKQWFSEAGLTGIEAIDYPVAVKGKKK